MRNNGVKNIEKYHGLGIDELKKMPTKQLLAIQKSARGCNICSDCGHGHHCSDDVLNDAQREWNDRQWHLLNKVQQILPTREHVEPRSKSIPKAKSERKDKRLSK